MKTNIYAFILYFLLVSCTVKPPELVVKGVQTEKALSFLSERQSKKVNKDQFDNYMQHLRLNYAPGFQWDEYWSGVSERKLYKNLSQEDLDQLLSLSQISCERKDWIAFSNLLLQIGKDEGKLLFSRELSHSQTLCSVWLPDPVFKSIVQFLSEKRSELETKEIAKEKIAYMNKKGQSVSPATQQAKQSFIYTGELQKVLINEWLRRHTGRNWGEVLSVVDREFWSDIRYLNYLSGEREHLATVLEMERHLYKSIEAGLDLDVLLMFQETGKMADIMERVGYEKYFSVPGALDWGSLWEKMSIQYPEKPENGNINSLLNFYKFKFSCKEEILDKYKNLVRQWKQSIYERAISSFCDKSKQDAIFTIYSPEELNKYAKEVSHQLMEQAAQETLDKLNKSKYRLLDESLGTPSKTIQVFDVSVKTGTKNLRTIEEIIALLFVFKAEKFDRTRKDWQALFEKHFSELDWLFAMHVFRDRGNSFLLSEILDMHSFVYGDNSGNPGKISFLYMDVSVILDSEVISLTGIVNKYGYKRTYIYTDEIIDLFWKDLKSSLSENRENLKRVVSVYEEEKQLRTSKQWKKLLERYFVDQNWLNLLSLLREKVRQRTGENQEAASGRLENKQYSPSSGSENVSKQEDDSSGIKILLSKVWSMLYEIYEGKKQFFDIFETDVQSIIESEGISLTEIAEKYNYDKTYMKNMMEEADKLYWQKLRDSLAETPGNLLKTLLVYERDKHLRTPEEWKALLEKYFDEKDWLNLMRFLRNERTDISKTRLSKVLDMHYEIGEGKISFLDKDIEFILDSEEISLAGIVNKYNYKYDYVNTNEIVDMFWQKFKKSVEETPENLVKILSIYEEEKLLRSGEEWKKLLDKYFVEQDWLNLLSLLREKIEKKVSEESLSELKVTLSRVLDMHHEIYGGEIPFLEKDIQLIIESEGISLADISDKYGYSEIYIEDVEKEAGDMFWRKLKESLEKDPGNLARILSIYEKEKSNQPSDPPEKWREKWRKLLGKYFVEEDWLKLMRFFQSRNDFPSVSKVLDMHYTIYNGKIPFFQNYIQMVLRSVNDNEVHLSSINAQSGFRDIYVENHDVYYQFWNKVKDSVNERDIINWKTFLSEENSRCGFSHIKKLFLFFSQLNKEHLLISEFKFKNCAYFIRDFRVKEWNRLVPLVRRGEYRSSETVNSSFVWWLARVLFLYSEEEDSLIREAVSKISASKWKDLLRGMLETYVSKSPDVDNDLFQRTLEKVRLVYNDEVESVLCSFFAGEKSLFVIREYDPKWIMDLFHSLSWSKRSNFSAGRRKEKKYCGDLISTKDKNVLLYALSQSLFKKKDSERNGNNSQKDLMSGIWSVSTEVMDLSIKMNDFEENDIWSLSFKALLNIRKEMNEYDFYLQFSDDILELLLSVSNGDKAFVSDYLVNHVWTEEPVSNYHAAYRGWIKELLRDKSDDYPYPPGSKRYVPLPYSLWPENVASSIRGIYDNLVKIYKSRPSGDYPWPPGSVREIKFSREPDTVSSASQSNKDKSREIQSVSSDDNPDPKTDYGQIFIEETSASDDFNYEISVFSGLEGGNPYISSDFFGFEIKRRVYSVISLGIDYSFYNSKATTTIKALENAYGLEFSDPFLKEAVYLNGHYNVFRSHLNLAGFFKVRLDVPLQFGLGTMSMGKNDNHFSMKWGVGPRFRFGSRWGIQYLFSQSVSAREYRFFYTWHSLVLSCSF